MGDRRIYRFFTSFRMTSIMHYKGFWICIVVSIVLYMAGLPWVRNVYAFCLPLVLWLICFANAWWESKALGWAAFSTSFIVWMTILGAFAMGWRMNPHLQVGFFIRAMVMYGALTMASLYSIKGLKKNE